MALDVVRHEPEFFPEGTESVEELRSPSKNARLFRRHKTDASGEGRIGILWWSLEASLAIRTCPLCFGKAPAGAAAAQSDGLECPGCGQALEVSRPSRVLGALAGIIGAWIVFRLTRGGNGALGWALPLVYSALAYGIVSALYMMLTADLVVKREQR